MSRSEATTSANGSSNGAEDPDCAPASAEAAAVSSNNDMSGVRNINQYYHSLPLNHAPAAFFLAVTIFASSILLACTFLILNVQTGH